MQVGTTYSNKAIFILCNDLINVNGHNASFKNLLFAVHVFPKIFIKAILEHDHYFSGISIFSFVMFFWHGLYQFYVENSYPDYFWFCPLRFQFIKPKTIMILFLANVRDVCIRQWKGSLCMRNSLRRVQYSVLIKYFHKVFWYSDIIASTLSYYNSFLYTLYTQMHPD